MKTGPLILVEDDEDDKYLFEKALLENGLKNTLIWFNESNSSYHYLETTADQPFLIICDINLPGLGGLDFKRKIDENHNLRQKSIPFIFFSTSIDQAAINKAYTELTVQGFFQKPDSFSEFKKVLQLIHAYWKTCKHPNSR